jgi:hypothetical protein
MFFGGNIAAALNSTDAPFGWNWTFWQKVLKPVVLELGDKGLLAPALVAPVSTLPVVMSGTTAPDVEFCVREASPYLYILASKREGTTLQITFSGLPSWATSGELLYEAPRTVTVQNGQFTDWFGPNEVHAYRFYNPNGVLYGDFDKDGDVDQSDFAYFQLCYSGYGIPQTDPACQPDDLNHDGFVDLPDLSLFAGCMSGSKIPLDPNCVP